MYEAFIDYLNVVYGCADDILQNPDLATFELTNFLETYFPDYTAAEILETQNL
jgi:hypothetical protein